MYNYPMFPAIFLDRDGVIIENKPDYVRSWEEVKFYPRVLQSLAKVKDCPHKIVIITNQAGVGYGIIPRLTAEEINIRLVDAIQQSGGRVDGVYMCPHIPQDGCDCRKPRPGLLFQAAQELSIDLSRSILIGDNITDLQAGLAAGLKHLFLVRTGLGLEQNFPKQTNNRAYFLSYVSLVEALDAIIGSSCDLSQLS